MADEGKGWKSLGEITKEEFHLSRLIIRIEHAHEKEEVAVMAANSGLHCLLFRYVRSDNA